jgi:hypothetical protein
VQVAGPGGHGAALLRRYRGTARTEDDRRPFASADELTADVLDRLIGLTGGDPVQRRKDFWP